jgi:hypothetical protein
VASPGKEFYVQLFLPKKNKRKKKEEEKDKGK